MLLGDILRRNAKLYPDKTAIIYGEKKISYRGIDKRVKKLAKGLLANGIQKNDRIGLLEHPCPQFIELYIAVPKIGAVLVPLNCRLSGRELKYIINDAKVKMLIIGNEFANTIDLIMQDLKTVTSIYCIEDSPAHIKNYSDLIETSLTEHVALDVKEDEVAVQMYTSGTTGKPKGAMLTHKNLMSNNTGRIIDLKLDANDTFLSCIPYYHVAAEYPLIILYVGGTLVIHRDFDPHRLLRDIRAKKPSILLLVPSMINFVLQYIENHPGNYDFSSIRLLIYGASSMPVAILKKAIETFQCGFIQSYGLTEASPGVTFLMAEDHILQGSKDQIKRLASCGKEVFNVEVRIVNKADADVEPGEIGEIIVKGDNVMKGYWQLPMETEKSIKNGWLYTGDMGTVDEKGYIFIVDRKKDMIISGGENIYPREVEEVLYEHPAILEAAVIGIFDDKWGESVKAFVVLKPQEKVSGNEIISFCKKNMASYKKPKSVEFMDSLPRNPTGKVLKNKLREKAKKK